MEKQTIRETTNEIPKAGAEPLCHILLCDDDPAFLSEVSLQTTNTLDRLGIPFVLHAFTSMEQLSAPVLAACDIALLDVDFEQKRYTGIDIAKKLRSVRKDAVIIFITNYIEYAPEGYEVQAFRYLLKKDLHRRLPEYLQAAALRLKNTRQTFKIKIHGEVIDIPLKQVLYMESQGRKVTVYIKKDSGIKEYSYYASISTLEKQLADNGFLRIHKSYLVNMRYLKAFRHDKAILSTDILLPVSQKNYAARKQEYLFWKGC